VVPPEAPQVAPVASSVTNVDDGGTIATGVPADIRLLDWAAMDDGR